MVECRCQINNHQRSHHYGSCTFYHNWTPKRETSFLRGENFDSASLERQLVRWQNRQRNRLRAKLISREDTPFSILSSLSLCENSFRLSIFSTVLFPLISASTVTIYQNAIKNSCDNFTMLNTSIYLVLVVSILDKSIIER